MLPICAAIPRFNYRHNDPRLKSSKTRMQINTEAEGERVGGGGVIMETNECSDD